MLTTNDGKEKEHDGIEEAEAHGQGVLVHDRRDNEHGEHGSCSEFLFRQLQGSENERKFRGQFSWESVLLDLEDCHSMQCGNTGRPYRDIPLLVHDIF